MASSSHTTARGVVVLLVDDQPIIGEAVRRMLATEEGMTLHICTDAARALDTAVAAPPHVILQDLVMPRIDGLDLVRRYRADERLRDVPVIVLSARDEPAVKADAFAAGANDYVVKLPDRLELVARLRYHARGYMALLERNEAFAALQTSQQMLADDIASAARYVRSLLPEPLRDGPVRADWRFIPSAMLGGDAFGYHAIDEHSFAIYLLDVCGHGVGAALLSVSALNAIRSSALPHADFRDPGSVLAGLNAAFPMERHNDMFFTAWYGVYHAPSRRLAWSGGGHPPALLVDGTARRPHLLESEGPLVGAIDAVEFSSRSLDVPPDARLVLYSDGAYEIPLPNGSMWGIEGLVEVVSRTLQDGDNALEAIVAGARLASGHEDFADDMSVVDVCFR